MHDIRHNPVNDEIVVPNPFSNAILTFRGGSGRAGSGGREEATIRIIQGPEHAPKWTISGEQTTLRKPFTVALNPDDKEIYVTDMRLNGVMTFSVPEV